MPDPQILKLYNEAIPDGAERIVKMAEREQRHQHRLHYFSIILTGLGEVLAGAVVICAMIGSFWLVSKNKTFEGAAGFVGALAIPAGGYWARRSQKGKKQEHPQEDENK